MNRTPNKDFNVAGFNKESIKEDELILSEHPFYTVQGEGLFSGVPSFFVRTSFCSLKCNFCSIGETKIVVNEIGSISINNAKVGQHVKNYNFFTGENDYEEIKNIIIRIVSMDDIRVLEFTNNINGITNKIFTTKDHQLYSISKSDWVSAEDFQLFEEVQIITSDQYKYSLTGKRLLDSIERSKYALKLEDESFDATQIKVYSLQLENNKNYFTDGFLSHNCDTISVWDKYKFVYSYEEIYNKLQALNSDCRLIIFSGGEPALQTKQSFLDYFHNKEYKINIETSGSYYVEALKGLDFICLSPKRLSDQSGFQKLRNTSKDKYLVKDEVLQLAHEVKFIIEDNMDDSMFLNFVKHIQEINKNAVILLSPMDSYNLEENKKNREKLISLTLSQPNLFRISLQNHKQLGMA